MPILALLPISFNYEKTRLCRQGTDYKSGFLPNILSDWTNDVTNILKVTRSMFLTICHFIFSILFRKHLFYDARKS